MLHCGIDYPRPVLFLSYVEVHVKRIMACIAKLLCRPFPDLVLHVCDDDATAAFF